MSTDPTRPTPIDWTRFDTDAHRAAQAACTHLIHCAVDGATRHAVSAMLDSARTVGDGNGILLAIAQLTGPCTVPPAPVTESPDPSPDSNPTTGGSRS